MAVLHHRAADCGGAGDGVLGIGGDGPGALPFPLHFCRQASHLGAGGRAGAAGADARGLQPLQIAALYLPGSHGDCFPAGAGVLLSRLSQHPPLDSVWRLLHFSAVGDRQAGDGAVPGLVSLDAAGPDAGLEKHAAAGGAGTGGFCHPDCSPAGPGHGAGTGRGHADDAVPGRGGVEVPDWRGVRYAWPLCCSWSPGGGSACWSS